MTNPTPRNTRRTLVAATATALTVGVLAGTAVAATFVNPPTLPYWERTGHACPQEDSVNCYWNAAEQGNGTGWSYYVRLVPGKARMVCVFYSTHPGYDYCESTR